MNRLSYIDAVKGVAILCITLLHFEAGIFPVWLNNWIGAFMVSTFYFTAGWVSGANGKFYTAKEIFIKRFWQLGVPYFWFSILLLAFDVLFWLVGWFDLKIVLRDLYKTLCLRGIGTLWFLPVLLAGETLFWMVRSNKRPCLVGTILFGISIVASMLYNKYAPLREQNDLYKLIDAPVRQIVCSLSAWQIVAIGYFAGLYGKPLLQRANKWALALIGIFCVAFSILIRFVPNVFIISGILSQILPEIGMICLFFAASCGFIATFFTYWGKNSLILMCIHFTIVMELCMMFDKWCLHRQEFTGWPTLIYFVITVFIIWLLVPLFHGKLNFMLKQPQKA